MFTQGILKQRYFILVSLMQKDSVGYGSGPGFQIRADSSHCMRRISKFSIEQFSNTRETEPEREISFLRRGKPGIALTFITPNHINI